MNLETFVEKFDQFADAPAAVAKMRELVLHLAVTGKLVPQDPNDEPADSILRDSHALFDRLVAAKKLSAPKPLPPVEDDEVPFLLPIGWAACRFGQIMRISSGDGLIAKDMNAGPIPVYGGNGVNGYHDAHNVAKRTLVIGRVGFYCGSIHVTPERAWVTDNAFITKFDEEHVDMDFLSWLLKATDLRERDNATAQPVISGGKVYPTVLALPPLAEQKRIVAKVNELMALCNQLEAQQQERETRHAALARASLARFADAPTPANLNFLFHKSYTITPADLRKSILTLAVQGKIAPQDPNEEPAEVLAARIAATRRANGAKEHAQVSEDESPYEVPFSWTWVRLGNISLMSDSGWSPQCDTEPRMGTDWGVLKVSAVTWGVFKPEENKSLLPGMTGRPECEVHAGDFLLSRANTSDLVARSVVVDAAPPRLMMSDKIVRFTFPDEIVRAFIHLANTSDPSREYYARNASGTSSSMKNIGREVMCNLPIPLPPAAEQRRIVAKVDQLMALVDQLETQLAASRTTAAKLLEALVAELTASA